MSAIKVALIQMHCPKGHIKENLAITAKYIKEAISNRADVILFPEMSITGYIDPTTMPETVLTLNSDAVEQFCTMTKETTLTAIAGIVEKNPNGKPFITQIVASEGKLKGYYRKINVAEDEAHWFAPGDETLLHKHGDIPFGVVVCADVGHGDLFETYAKQGAKVVFAAAAPGLYGSQDNRDWQKGFDWWHGECTKNLSKFARDGNLYIAVATQAGRTINEDFPGGGYLFNSKGELIAETPDWSEGTLYAQISLM